jgi:hypothetical protein
MDGSKVVEPGFTGPNQYTCFSSNGGMLLDHKLGLWGSECVRGMKRMEKL